jgi:cytochrome c biogenesis protein CcdA
MFGQIVKYLLLSLGLVFFFSSVVEAENQIVFFYGQGCPHCAVVEEYFTDNNILSSYPIVIKEIYGNPQNAVEFTATMEALSIPQNEQGVPAVVIGDQVLMGDKPIIDNFTKLADAFLASNANQAPTPAPTQDPTNSQSHSLTLLMVIGAALVDAINPCAFAVLIILMTTVLAAGSAVKALKTGLAFSLAIFISYFLMGMGLYQAIHVVGLSSLFMKIVGGLAIILGLLNLKDYFWYGKGVLMEVPLSWRPKMKSLIHSITSPVGAFLIGFLVSLFLLPCTSGPYIVILGMLADTTKQLEAAMYLLLYNFIFVLPMIVITFLVYRGLNPEKLEKLRQTKLRTLHLIAGVILILMGLALLTGFV